ncbi:unnamed protein product [Vitrella brassicaformis CCMP3155]|uniref:RING-type domain-containing protein n=2 Tax=Vitrella brassicaformis TaxID=1169539 RepID=A0A0G4GNS2_VITBC|nr:unnamed protein product [Vitrella brassicaformis CCMP3155]|eukprot:CEM31932.1 unnamed protein product [Vitrella brassicaformis CCMP3155]
MSEAEAEREGEAEGGAHRSGPSSGARSYRAHPYQGPYNRGSADSAGPAEQPAEGQGDAAANNTTSTHLNIRINMQLLVGVDTWVSGTPTLHFNIRRTTALCRMFGIYLGRLSVPPELEPGLHYMCEFNYFATDGRTHTFTSETSVTGGEVGMADGDTIYARPTPGSALDMWLRERERDEGDVPQGGMPQPADESASLSVLIKTSRLFAYGCEATTDADGKLETTAGSSSSPVERTAAAAASASSLAERTDQDTCSICLDTFATGQVVRRILKCGHQWHAECVDPHFALKAHCPVCRLDLREAAVEQQNQAGGKGGDAQH